MNNTEIIEIDAHCIKQSPDYDVSYFDAKRANDAMYEAREEAKRALKAIKQFRRGEISLEVLFKHEYAKYRQANKNAKIITNQYIKQCKARNL